jgi:hypothetical protein
VRGHLAIIPARALSRSGSTVGGGIDPRCAEAIRPPSQPGSPSSRWRALHMCQRGYGAEGAASSESWLGSLADAPSTFRRMRLRAEIPTAQFWLRGKAGAMPGTRSPSATPRQRTAPGVRWTGPGGFGWRLRSPRDRRHGTTSGTAIRFQRLVQCPAHFAGVSDVASPLSGA